MNLEEINKNGFIYTKSDLAEKTCIYESKIPQEIKKANIDIKGMYYNTYKNTKYFNKEAFKKFKDYEKLKQKIKDINQNLLYENFKYTFSYKDNNVLFNNSGNITWRIRRFPYSLYLRVTENIRVDCYRLPEFERLELKYTFVNFDEIKDNLKINDLNKYKKIIDYFYDTIVRTIYLTCEIPEDTWDGSHNINGCLSNDLFATPITYNELIENTGGYWSVGLKL